MAVRDRRKDTIAAVILLLLVLGLFVSLTGQRDFGGITPSREPAREAGAADTRRVHQRFQQAVAMIEQRQYEHAVVALHDILKTNPTMPEAHANMGFALIGLQQFELAQSFFETAIELRPGQVNAYYGLAIASKARGMAPDAISAMQVFMHLAANNDPFLARAQAALQQWRGDLPAGAQR